MKLKNFTRPALVAALLAVSGAASATSMTWDFQTSPPANHLWGTSQAFDTDPTSGNMITAYGFTSTGAATDVFSKWSGAGSDETGLGLNIDPDGDHEIITGASIVFDMSAVQAKLGNTYTIVLGSLQSYTGAVNENANIFECTTVACSTKALLGNISGPPSKNGATYTLGAGYSFFEVLDVAAGGGADVLVDSITAASVPEPATLGLLGLGLAGLGFMRRRKVN